MLTRAGGEFKWSERTEWHAVARLWKCGKSYFCSSVTKSILLSVKLVFLLRTSSISLYIYIYIAGFCRLLHALLKNAPQLAAYIYGKPNVTWTQHDCWLEASRGPAFNKPHLCLIKPPPLYLRVWVNTEGGWAWSRERLSLYTRHVYTVAHVARFIRSSTERHEVHI